MTEPYDGVLRIPDTAGDPDQLVLIDGDPITRMVEVHIAYDEHADGCDQTCDPLFDEPTTYLELTVDQALELRHALDRALAVATRRLPNVVELPTRDGLSLRLHLRDPDADAGGDQGAA